MQFFSGFSLQNEKEFFKDYIDESEYCVAGFSYGAIKALAFVKTQLQMGVRVDRLQLLSPAFFQTKEKKFKKLQLMGYKKNKQKYLESFMQSCFAPYSVQKVQQVETKEEELQELLEYVWNDEDFAYLEKKGVVVEVFLGGKDSIIDVEGAREFFLQNAIVTYIKDANHFLQIN